MASATVSAGNTGQSTFNAVSHTDDGEVQSYYLSWSGMTSSSSANLSITK